MGTLINATGSRRRLEALAALGHTARTIGAHMPNRPAGSIRALVCTWKHRDRRLIDAGTAADITRVYEQLRDQPGTNTVVRINALRAGYRTPDAWDGLDIDDPGARPNTGDDEDEECAA